MKKTEKTNLLKIHNLFTFKKFKICNLCPSSVQELDLLPSSHRMPVFNLQAQVIPPVVTQEDPDPRVTTSWLERALECIVLVFIVLSDLLIGDRGRRR